MKPNYDPTEYWNRLLAMGTDVRSVGHPQLGLYNRIAYTHRLRALVQALGRRFPDGIPKGTRVFEAGFGVGFYLSFWKSLGLSNVSGVDISEEAVRRAMIAFPDYSLARTDLSEPAALKQEPFDLVTAIDVLYHIVDDSRWETALANLCSSLKKGGTLILTDKFPDHGAVDTAPHVRRRSRSQYETALARHGIVPVEVSPVFALMDDPIFRPSAPLLSLFAIVQWRVVSRAIRLLGFSAVLRDAMAVALGALQYPAELTLLKVCATTPNLEILVAEKI